jgi:hypothetical protein
VTANICCPFPSIVNGGAVFAQDEYEFPCCGAACPAKLYAIGLHRSAPKQPGSRITFSAW